MNQKEVDQLVQKTESLVDKITDCQTACMALKYVKKCLSLQDNFFIPAIVASWELWCMTYIPDDILRGEFNYGR